MIHDDDAPRGGAVAWAALVGIGWIVLALGAIGLLWLSRQEPAVRPGPSVDTLAVITSILQGDKTADRLIDRWPDAPRTMKEAADREGLDPYLLPCIARAERMTEAMHQARNPYGLEVRGKLLGWKDYYYSTAAAAKLLKRNEHRWRAENGVDMRALAEWWCPKNAETWAQNVGAVYRGAWRIK